MDDINSKLQEKSHSGASLNVIKNGDEYYVKKIVVGDVSRNFKAINKQKYFKTIVSSNYTIQSISVEEVDNNDELMFTMPYIQGVCGELYAIYGSRTSAIALRESLNCYFMERLSKSTETSISSSVIKDKISGIEIPFEQKELKEILDYSKKYIENNCPEQLYIPICECHGDLTLSNMIVSENKLFLFDFLDSFIESPLQDAAKLIQDIKYGWSFRKMPSSIKIKGDIFCKAAYPNFLDTLNRLYEKELKILELVTLLRIIPYLKQDDKITSSWVVNAIRKYFDGAFK